MPTFEPGLVAAVVLPGACLLFGVSFALLVHALGARMRARMQAGVRGPDRQRAHARTAARPGLLALARPLMPAFAALGEMLGLRSVRSTLVGSYARAGWPGGLEDDEVLALGLMLGLLCALPVVAVIAVVEPLAAPLGLLTMAAGPGLLSQALGSRSARRELAITRTMPFVLDLLVLSMRAGASLQQAIERVTLDHARHPIGAEFRAILADLEMGVTTAEAFQNMAERVPIPAVKTFVDDLLGAEELGRPLADIFERQALQARVRRVQEAMDTAGRAKVMVLVPGMLVFLAALLLLFAPFIVRFVYGGYSTL